MTPTNGGELSPQLKLVYDEYLRLHERAERLIHSSFDDFKLLGIFGAVLGAPPLTEYFEDKAPGALSDELRLLAYLVLFAILAVLSFRDLMKQLAVTTAEKRRVRVVVTPTSVLFAVTAALATRPLDAPPSAHRGSARSRRQISVARTSPSRPYA